MTADLANHLWQSTAFAIAAWLLTLVLRRNRAQVRYWVWLSASLKFLVPFSLLMSAGRHLEWAPAIHKIAPAAPAITSAMVQMNQSFSDALPPMPATADPRDWIVSVIIGLWACGFLAIVLVRIRAWSRIRAAVRSSTAIGAHAGMEVRSLPGLRGPGVVGYA
ncbi:MAG: hypothetical protein ACRD6B_05085 [Bryobacteraceae bacterium]